MSECPSQIVTYIAGFVSRSIQKNIKCENCRAALIGNRLNFLNSLISQKTHDGLIYPSADVIKICVKAERFLRIFKNNMHKKNIVLMLSNKIISECLNDNLLEDLGNHVLESPVNHIYFLIKSICMKYIDIRIHFITKVQSQKSDPIM